MKSSSDIKQILDYLRELQVNNDRSWFKSHKERYDALRQAWERDMERLITLVGQWDDNVRGLMVRDCVYRIYRDTRFSANKAPYKNYFSGVLGRGGRHTIMASYYVHFEPDHCLLCGGIWWPEKDILNRLRELIDAEPQEFLHIAQQPDIAQRYHWECQTLKKMPQGYPVDHPLAQFIKMKEYLLMMPVDEQYFDCDDWVERVASDLRPLKPMHDFLNYVFD